MIDRRQPQPVWIGAWSWVLQEWVTLYGRRPGCVHLCVNPPLAACVRAIYEAAATEGER